MKRLKNVLAGCAIGVGAAALTDKSALGGCAVGGGGAFLANKFLKSRKGRR